MRLHRLAVTGTFGLAIAAAAGLVIGREPQVVAQGRTAAVTTSLDDQVDLAVTVYNSNIALVRDVRQL